MMGIERKTQGWSKATQEQGFAKDNSNSAGTEDWKKAFGDKDLGEVLNKVADKNWVDPAKTRHVGNDKLDKDAFLKLLLAQLKNQDPTTPMKSHEMAAQLAQFSSLEKLENIDSGINKLANVGDPKHSLDALNLIGKAIYSDSSRIIRNDNKEEHDIKFNLMADAQKVEMKIKSPEGEVVRTLEINGLKTGQNEVTWNGADEEGKPMGKGEYSVVVEAFDNQGKKVGVENKFAGVITGVNFGAEGPILLMGNKKVKMQDVSKIVDPKIMQKEISENKANITNASQEKIDASNVGKIKPEEGANNSAQSNKPSLDKNIALSSGIRNKLQKEIGHL